MSELAEVTRHLTPAALGKELKKLNHNGLDILTVHLKPSYRKTIIEELKALGMPNLKVMEPGQTYSW
jgi:cAMP phosphodiesterase